MYPEQLKGGLIAGVDEAGRGPLVGNVVAAAVILDDNNPIQYLNDSKKLTAKKREQLYTEITEKSLAWSVAHATAKEIDQINILQASLLAMQRAVLCLGIKPDLVLIDGNRCPNLDYPTEAIVKGDTKVAQISAASILAKVVRDRQMLELHKQYPMYGFDKHKGYPTSEHLKRLETEGVLAEHRRSFKPVRNCLQQADIES